MAYNPYYGNPYFPQQQGYYNNGAMPDMLNQQKMQYQQISPQQPMAMHNEPMLWVLGQTEAESYPVAPNNTVTLWDKNQPTIYIKSANAQGVPSIRVLDFTERSANTPKTPEKHDCQCGDKFATKEQLTALEGKYDEIMAIVEELKAKPIKKTTKASEE
jgi:hypothetical protein